MKKITYEKYSKGKSYQVIAVCVARFHEQITMDILKAICNKSKDAKCKVMIFSTCSDFSFGDRSDQGERTFMDIFHVECFDGIVIMSETFKDDVIVKELVSRAKNHLVPVISVDKYIEDCYNINFCYSNSFEKIVRHIVEEHHATRVNFIAGMKDNPFSDERIKCYKKVLEENNIPLEPERIAYGDFWERPAIEAIDTFLRNDPQIPEAIICANDMMAIAACKRLKEYGYQVPKDVIVTGFDGIELEKYHTPRLTTAEFNLDGLVNTIFEIVHACTNKKEIAKDHSLDYIFKKSCSCGCEPILIEDSSDKIYEMAILKKDEDFFNEGANRMVSHLNNLDNLKEVFEEFKTYLYYNDSKHFWLCTNDDLLEDNFDFNYAFASAKKKEEATFNDTMFIPIEKHQCDFQEGEIIQREELVPGLFHYLDNEVDYILFLPIHAEEMSMGYVAASIDINDFSYRPYRTLIVNFMHVLTNFKIQAEREHFYSKDMLTNLYNRRGFYKYINNTLEDCKEKKYPFAIVSIDMDGLKRINDCYGHKEGDYALCIIAKILLRVTKQNGIVSRFGGDEFIVALGMKNAEQKVNDLIIDIRTHLEMFNESKKKDYNIEASIGSYIRVPDNTVSLDDYIKYADNAMYSEKMKHKKINLDYRSRK